jgi:hypothetical protein
MNQVANYEQDFLTWTQQQADYLKKGCWLELDVKNLIEELESLGRSEQKEISSYFQVLVMHLLKCEYQPEKRTSSWNHTLSNCRDKIQDCLEDTPSLQRFLQDSEWIDKFYRRSRRDAAKETQISLEIFPAKCPYAIAQILDPDFLA